MVVGDGDRVELAHRVVALEDTARVLPGDRRAGLDLRPRDLRVHAPAGAALGDEIENAALAVLVAGIPVLDRRVFDLGVVERDELHHRRVELVLIAHGGRAAFQVADVAARIGDDQRAFELPGVLGVYAEVGGQLHGAAHAAGDIDETAVAEDRRIQRGVEVVRIRNHRAQVLAHHFGVRLHGFGKGAKDDPLLGKLLLVGGGHRNAVEDGVHRHPGEHFLLLEGNAELFIGAQQFGVDLVQAIEQFRGLRRRVVVRGLIVDGGVPDPRPPGLRHGEPAAIGLQPPIEQPIGLVLFRRDEADDVLVEAARRKVHVDVGDEAVLVVPAGRGLDGLGGIGSHGHVSSPSPKALWYCPWRQTLRLGWQRARR